MKISLGKIAAVAAVNAMTVAIGATAIFPRLQVEAAVASGGYTATWTQTQDRCVHIVETGATQLDSWLYLGPAGWNVTYALPGGSTIKEVWAVTGWTDNNPQTGVATGWATKPTGSCLRQITQVYGNINQGPNKDFYITGEYTAVSADFQGFHHGGTYYSLPKGWTVTGTPQ